MNENSVWLLLNDTIASVYATFFVVFTMPPKRRTGSGCADKGMR